MPSLASAWEHFFCAVGVGYWDSRDDQVVGLRSSVHTDTTAIDSEHLPAIKAGSRRRRESEPRDN